MIGGWNLMVGDCRELMARLEAGAVDSVVTDPPYGLSFMGKGWDHGVPSVEFWTEAIRVAKPGAHLLAFGGTRTHHRLACEIEDAGWEIRDCVMWLYGSGVPKSLDVSKAIDKAAGHWRGRAGAIASDNVAMSGGNYERTPKGNAITAAAAAWRGWGTALKPAWEPIIVARKPLEGTVAASVLKHGTGAINVDAGRVETEDKLGGGMVSMGRPKVSKGWDRPWMHNKEATERKKVESAEKVAKAESLGRWPANVLHDGSEEVLAAFAGEVSRFFKCCPWSEAELRVFYCAKASRRDRGESNRHPTVKPNSLMRYLCRLVTPPGGVVLDPFCGSGSTGKAAAEEGFGFIGMELDEAYAEIARSRIGGVP
jgi:site-specific DNA-methyltransferase (adenine-specific)